MLIVEDEFITQQLLAAALGDFGYEVSGTAMDAETAIEILEKGDTDLAILDIHIEGTASGIWIGQQIRDRFHIPFIYLTAYQDEATMNSAIDTAPEGYLIKPFKQPDLRAAIEVALRNFGLKQQAKSEQPQAQEREEEAPVAIRDAIFVKDNYAYVKLVINEIRHIHSDRNYLEIVTSDQKHMIRSSLRAFLDLLPTDVFAQVHRSWVVNVGEISSFTAANVQVGDTQIPLAPAYRDDLMARFRTM